MTTGEIKSMKAANTTVSGTYEHHLKSIKLLIDQPNIDINETDCFIDINIWLSL